MGPKKVRSLGTSRNLPFPLRRLCAALPPQVVHERGQ
jgi:hypothetical protein